MFANYFKHNLQTWVFLGIFCEGFFLAGRTNFIQKKVQPATIYVNRKNKWAHQLRLTMQFLQTNRIHYFLKQKLNQNIQQLKLKRMQYIFNQLNKKRPLKDQSNPKMQTYNAMHINTTNTLTIFYYYICIVKENKFCTKTVLLIFSLLLLLFSNNTHSTQSILIAKLVKEIYTYQNLLKINQKKTFVAAKQKERQRE
eukprot:TRINITY_DN2964_c0_g1_i1.p3 TRINITY_DN2964_c0_g1~~TRINITY_DN2964_c0_g1_i1.p3  ORF type:complete len:197 (+),score=-5.24 TRINITY_DN2964_c0_g1_i1:1350-1940(+)